MRIDDEALFRDDNDIKVDELNIDFPEYDADDVVECQWCHDYVPRGEAKHEKDLGYICDRCAAAIKSRGEKLEFDDLDEDYNDYNDGAADFADMMADEYEKIYKDDFEEDDKLDYPDADIFEVDPDRLKRAKRIMEEVEDEVECCECYELKEKANCTKTKDGDYICNECAGKKLTEDATMHDAMTDYTCVYGPAATYGKFGYRDELTKLRRGLVGKTKGLFINIPGRLHSFFEQDNTNDIIFEIRIVINFKLRKIADGYEIAKFGPCEFYDFDLKDIKYHKAQDYIDNPIWAKSYSYEEIARNLGIEPAKFITGLTRLVTPAKAGIIRYAERVGLEQVNDYMARLTNQDNTEAMYAEDEDYICNECAGKKLTEDTDDAFADFKFLWGPDATYGKFGYKDNSELEFDDTYVSVLIPARFGNNYGFGDNDAMFEIPVVAEFKLEKTADGYKIANFGPCEFYDFDLKTTEYYDSADYKAWRDQADAFDYKEISHSLGVLPTKFIAHLRKAFKAERAAILKYAEKACLELIQNYIDELIENDEFEAMYAEDED